MQKFAAELKKNNGDKMRDFTLDKYKELLNMLINKEFAFITDNSFNDSKSVFLRHDVDRSPKTALRMAQLEKGIGVKSTYYFRMVPESYDEKIILEIVALGHKIGYHYENLATTKGDYSKAIVDFESNLNKLRKLVEIKFMCMHGSPTSKWDNRELWHKYDYKDYGIEFEPYFDIDFDKIYYLTDAGRSWNNEKVSMRDKVLTKYDFEIKSTQDIIKLIDLGTTPKALMISTHPHNWSEGYGEWFKIKIWQESKNIIKRIIIARRSKND